MMFEDEYVDVDSEIKVRRPAPSDDAPHLMRPVPVSKVDNAESHALSSTTRDTGALLCCCGRMAATVAAANFTLLPTA